MKLTLENEYTVLISNVLRDVRNVLDNQTETELCDLAKFGVIEFSSEKFNSLATSTMNSAFLLSLIAARTSSALKAGYAMNLYYLARLFQHTSGLEAQTDYIFCASHVCDILSQDKTYLAQFS